MENCIDREQVSLATPRMQVIKNIECALKELDAFAKPTFRANSHPTYRTLFSLNFEGFYDRFGSENTKLFRLTKTHLLEHLPQLCIVHTIPELEENQDCPILVKDKIFISHQYFRNWLIAEDKDAYEKEILELILSSLEVKSYNQSN